MQVESQSKIGIGFVRSYASWELAYQGRRPWKLSSLEEREHSGNKDLLMISFETRLMFNFQGEEFRNPSSKYCQIYGSHHNRIRRLPTTDSSWRAQSGIFMFIAFHKFTHNFWRQTLKIYPPNIFSIRGQPDVAIVNPMYSGTDCKLGILVGIEVKTEIVTQSIIQAQIGCLLIAANSNFPTLQVCHYYF